MKKTFTKPDGTTETIEGTPEELAAYEKKLREEDIKEERKNKKRLLTEEQLAQVRKMIDEALLARPPNTIIINPIQTAPALPSYPIDPPNFNPWIYPLSPFITYGDSLNVKDDGHLEQLQLEAPSFDVRLISSAVEPEQTGGNVITIQAYGPGEDQA